jgi:hypothetical protein
LIRSHFILFTNESEKFLKEVQKEMQKDVLYSASRKKHKEQQAGMIIASFQKYLTLHQAQSSQAKEISQTKPKEVPYTQEYVKTRRRSVCQQQKRKCLGYVLPIKKPPVKKPRQDRVSAQVKKEEKEEAEKENAVMLAYICQAICSAGPEGCYHDGQDNVFTKGPNKNGSNCCTYNRIVQSVTKQMWCQCVQQRPYLMMCSKLNTCPNNHQKSS